MYEQKTEEILLPIVEEYGFELVDVEYVKEGSNWYLRAYIDKPGGIGVNDCEVVSRRLSDILDEAKEKPFYPIVSRQVLRSMAKAKYSETPIGHYGLALENYAHFTSPIRRYPDLTIHRILSDVVAKKRSLSDIKKRYSEFVGKSANASPAAIK